MDDAAQVSTSALQKLAEGTGYGESVRRAGVPGLSSEESGRFEKSRLRGRRNKKSYSFTTTPPPPLELSIKRLEAEHQSFYFEWAPKGQLRKWRG